MAQANIEANSEAQARVRIVVVGGGAGGLELARRLGARHGKKRAEIILVDRQRTHIWKPLLHEVASGALDANLDEIGYAAHGARWGYRFVQGELAAVDRAAREIVTAPQLDEDGVELIGARRIRYDYLVLAVGAVSNDFGTPGVRDHTMYLENRVQADRCRTRLLDLCLGVSTKVETGADPDARVRVAIVGGGATGVELAASLIEAADSLQQYGLEGFDHDRMKITLLEAGPRILPALGARLAEAATEELREHDIDVRLGAHVAAADARGFVLADGERIDADLRVWAAGVKGQDALMGLGALAQNRAGQFLVRPTLQSVDDARIFCLGDCCSYTPEGQDRPVPPRAQSARQMQQTVFRNLDASMKGKPLARFHYQDKGSLISLARFETIGSLMGNLVGGRMAVEGRVARFVYVSLYRLHLLGVHGFLGGLVRILLRPASNALRPRLKLH